MSGIRVNEWLHNSGTGGIWQTSAGNVGIASSVPTTKLEVTGDAKISGVTTATAFIPSGGQLSHRNLIINGAMNVAQRGTSTTSEGYDSVDRFGISNNGLDENTTNSQHALTSSDTGPWAEGFRKSFHVQNGNQTGGAGVDDRVSIYYKPEAQDLAQSGWEYTSTSSYITLSFWVKSSVAQNFYFFFRTDDGTQMNYVMETGSLSANTWKKVTKIIPGHSNVEYTNDNGVGNVLEFTVFRGTNKTGTRALNTWEAYDSSVRVPDMTSTWYTTNDAIFEITGVQLEVGQAATPFEHRSFADELARCQRYFWRYKLDHAYGQYFSWNSYGSTDQRTQNIFFPTPMRASPSLSFESTYTNYQGLGLGGAISNFQLSDGGSNVYSTSLRVTTADTITSGLSGLVRGNNSTNGYFDFSSEL